jgi:hypothetical protein
MKTTSTTTISLLLTLTFGGIVTANAQTIYSSAVGVTNLLPKLEADSAKGLRLECSPSRERFSTNERVRINCRVINTTRETKPVGWTIGTGANFCLCPSNEPYWGGLLPEPIPHLSESLVVKDGYPLPAQKIPYLPPSQVVDFTLDCGYYDKPQKFKGRIVYDPIPMRNGWVSTNQTAGPPWADQLIGSETFAFEVVSEVNVNAQTDDQIANRLSFGPATNGLQAALEFTTSTVRNWAKVKPGRYTIRFWLQFPDVTIQSVTAANDMPQPGDWQGILKTAPVTIKVRDMGIRPSVSSSEKVSSQVAQHGTRRVRINEWKDVVLTEN